MIRGNFPADFSQTIEVEPQTAKLADVRRFVEATAGKLELEAEKVFDLKVAVSEACANAVTHAGRGTARVAVSALHRAGRLTFTVSDSGPFHAPTPARGDNRGLGLPLMVALMDEVTFSRGPGGGTTVSLSVIIAPTEA